MKIASHSLLHVLGKVLGALSMPLFIGRQISGNSQYVCALSHLRGQEDRIPRKTLMDTCITGDCNLNRTR